MIHGVYGKLGSGKGLVSMQVLLDEITKGTRDVVTNLPIRLHPWVSGSGEPQIGLLGYLRRHYKGEDFDAEQRIKVIEDMDQGVDLWLWRRHPDRGWFKVSCERDAKGDPFRFDAEEMRGCQPLLVITDESWQFYPSRSHSKIPQVVEFYGRQQRKLQDEWYIVTQHHKDLDPMLHRITQDHTVCRNHGMERLGIFRQPSIFRTLTYNTPPDKTARVFHERMFRLDVRGIAQCYDTSAGVGIAGGFAADRGAKRKGVNLIWGVVGLLLFVGALASIPFASSHITGPFLRRQVEGKGLAPKGLKTNGVAPESVPAVRRVDSPPVVSESASPDVLEPSKVKMTGFILIGGKPMVCLSDGRTATAGDGHLQLAGREWCVVDGIRYEF